MGVYIKGMEMPEEGNWRSVRIYPDGTIGRPIGFGDYALVEGAKAIPAADVRPVVLCRDCKYWKLSKIDPSFHVCTYVCGATFVRNAEDFCSRGEKGEES